MDNLRQRIPFKFSADGQESEDTRILDEQEQEEVIEDLRRENLSHTLHYDKFLQGCLSFTILFYCWFLVSPRQVTPVHVFFPNTKTPRPGLIIFTTWFTVIDILILLNVMLHLPSYLSFPRVLHSIVSNLLLHLPLHVQERTRPHIPFSIKWSTCILCVPPLIAVCNVADTPQVLWWSLPLFVVGIFVLVKSWIKEIDTEMEKLEKLKYEAKGA